MGLKENLFGRLAELSNLSFKGKSLHWVLQYLQVHFALVSNWVEYVVVFD
jgi:uncharacterized protein YpiB (UPF0302 family)